MRYLRTSIVRILLGVWLLIVIGVIYGNARLYAPSPLAASLSEAPPQLTSQLAANRAALESGAATRMQALFPEGDYFSYLFHGLAWVELAMRDAGHTEEAIKDASWCLQHMESPEGRAPFPPDLPPDHGMFYAAWKCHLRGGIVTLQQANDEKQLALWRDECDEIVAALQTSETPFLPSYHGAAWPCDTVPAIHALCTYDHLLKESRYRTFVKQWLVEVEERRDRQSGLLFAHTVSLPEGRAGSVARATSQVIVLRLLPDIAPLIAQLEYESFCRDYLTTFLGAPCVLEFPRGMSGTGDVDSGPLVFGRSLSATVFMMGVAQVYGDRALADAIARTGEVVGLPWTSDGKKQYAAGLLPIGDIMVTYAHVARPWFAQTKHHPDQPYEMSAWWRLPIHAVSLLVLLPALLLVWRRWRRGLKPKQESQESSSRP